jgi:hypothetical protein
LSGHDSSLSLVPAGASRALVRGGATARFLPGEHQCLVPNWTSRLLVGRGVTDPALACFSFPSLRSAIAAPSARSTTASSSSSGVINSVVSHSRRRIGEGMNVNARRGFERHVGGGFGLGKGKGLGERRRVPFKHELDHLLMSWVTNFSIKGRLWSTSSPGNARL